MLVVLVMSVSFLMLLEPIQEVGSSGPLVLERAAACADPLAGEPAVHEAIGAPRAELALLADGGGGLGHDGLLFVMRSRAVGSAV
jgi:hypothetical protein